MTKYFGTDGIRGVYGSPHMNDSFARSVGLAIGKFLSQKSCPSPCVVIGRDTRPSGASLQQSISEGVQASGGKIINAGTLPTPALAYAVLLHRADFGGNDHSLAQSPY